jgi:RNA polymerase sigma factor (sigma-70 family)
VARAAGRWKPDSSRARFRTWLYRVATNLLADHFHQRCAAMTSHESVTTACEAAAPSEQAVLADEFELEYRRALFHQAAATVRQRINQVTWDAFAATAIDSVPAAAVAARLGISIGSVYVARSRAMKLLRQEIERLQHSEACGEASATYTTQCRGDA